jgi:DNA invertase Pin-like site-specific DNA recombinase
LLVFMVDPDGDGVIAARLSNRDIQNGETALGQVHPALDAAKQLGLRPRLIVVSTGLSGGNRLSDRPDLELLEEEILGGRCRWVWFRGVDRISRRPQVFYTFVDLLETAGVALYLTEIPGRAVDWEKDEIQMSFNALMGSRERRAIYERTHGPLINRWLNEGRGWPGGLPFGFRRNKLTKYPEIDPVQWPFVRMAFEHYVQFEDGEGGGVRAVQEKLASEGCTISRETITRMIKRPIYFTGEWTTTRAGVTVENRPIEIPEDQRIPLDVWERVQNCRRLRRGKDKRTPPGLFALNRIGRLADGTRIRARLTTADPEEVIYYRPYVPEKGGSIPVRWRGWKVEARALHRAIFDEVLRLVDCKHLQEEWTRIARPDYGQAGPILDAPARADIDRKIHNLAEAIAQVERQFAMRLADEGAGGGDLFAERKKLLGPLELEQQALEEQLRRAAALESMRTTTRPAADAPLLEALRDVLGPAGDDEPALVLKRTAFLELALSEVVLDIGDDGVLLATLHGPLIPSDLPVLTVHDPVTALKDELEKNAANVDQQTHKSSLVSPLVGMSLPPLGSRNRAAARLIRHVPGLGAAWMSPPLPLDVRLEETREERPYTTTYDWAVVLRICDLRRTGWSMERIAGLFNDECVPTPRGGTWSSGTISTLLSNLRGRRSLPPDVEAAVAITRVRRVSTQPGSCVA